MDETKLRQLERQYKLRVKTGCETCRTRRVKCDETKPECVRCTKSGRKCEGYKHAAKSRDQSPAAAASFRNPSFLVVPQRSYPASIPKHPSRSVSPEAAENRSFFYFQTHTLPQWTEFFDSDLWSQKVLQLSHAEPAIKHGILALSTLHERFESTTPILDSSNNDFAFVQYMQAVKYSNDLLTAHREGKVDVEKVLIACIIFTCYENLAGNYRAANMHLRNGLRILGQHRRDMFLANQAPPSQDSIANVLYRFDLQAMTFSDNASPYEYSLDSPPECPIIPITYDGVADARNDLVGLLRCMMWISGVANINPRAPEHPTWLHIYTQLMSSFETWERVFETWETAFGAFELNLSSQTHMDPKTYAGNTLLKIYSVMARTIVAAGAGARTETAWDAFGTSFKTIVDLAETLPTNVRPPSPTPSRSSSHSSSSPPHISPGHSPSPSPGPSKMGPTNASSPGSTNSVHSPGAPGYAFVPESTQKQTTTINPPAYTANTKPAPKRKPAAFTPSFELSPIVPLFVTACRCRDPSIRRRAIALLLNCRRREGVWDSYGAGMVALQVVKMEEGIAEMITLGPENWLPLNPKYKEAADITESSRVQDVFVSVNMAERQIGVNYLMRSGESLDRYVRF